MPQRFLRPGLTTSQRFNSASWHAQIFYVRILTLVDDFGRYDAEPRLLRSHAFPFGDPSGKEIPVKTVENICEQLSASALIAFYQDKDGKKYLQVLRWQERARAEKSKYPPLDNTCEQMFSNDSKCSLPSPSPSPSPSIKRHMVEDRECEEIYEAYPRKVAKPEALRAIQKAISRGTSPGLLLDLTKRYASTTDLEPRFIPHPATWFNQERFNDDPKTWSNGASQTTGKPKYIDPNQVRIDEEYEAHRRKMEAKRK